MLTAKIRTDVSGILALVGKTKARTITLQGVRAGAKVLLKAARSMAPRRKRSGALRQAQGIKAAKGRRGNTISYAVQGAKTKFVKMVTPKGYRTPQKTVPANYDHLVEGGTQPHRLGKGESVGRAAVGRRRAVAGTSQTRGGQHPGTKPNPYRKRAYESVKGEVGAAMNRAMAEAIQKEIAKEAARVERRAH